MKCQKCGKEVAEGVTFCPACGEKVARPETPKGPEAEAEAAPRVQPAAAERASGTSGWAVASLVMGICGFTCLFFVGAVLAIVFAFVARGRIKRSGGELKGSGMAVAGMVLGTVLIAIVVVAVAVFVPISYVGVGPTRTVTKTVRKSGTSFVFATMTINRGTMNVSGGAPELMNGSFTYNVSKWRPIVSYRDVVGKGNLSVRQPVGESWTWFHTKNDWNIRLNDDVRLSVNVGLRAGYGTFDMKNMKVTELSVGSGEGNITADLPGDMALLERVLVTSGTGDIKLNMDGEYSKPIRLDADSGSGDIDINLLGEWKASLRGSIGLRTGDVTIRLPRDVGVYVKTGASYSRVKTTGTISARGDGVYVNSAYESAKITIRLDIDSFAGQVLLKEAD